MISRADVATGTCVKNEAIAQVDAAAADLRLGNGTETEIVVEIVHDLDPATMIMNGAAMTAAGRGVESVSVNVNVTMTVIVIGIVMTTDITTVGALVLGLDHVLTVMLRSARVLVRGQQPLNDARVLDQLCDGGLDPVTAQGKDVHLPALSILTAMCRPPVIEANHHDAECAVPNGKPAHRELVRQIAICRALNQQEPKKENLDRSLTKPRTRMIAGRGEEVPALVAKEAAAEDAAPVGEGGVVAGEEVGADAGAEVDDISKTIQKSAQMMALCQM